MFTRSRARRRRAALSLELLECRDLPSLGLLPFLPGSRMSQEQLLSLSAQALATAQAASVTTISLRVSQPDGSWAQGQLTVDSSASYNASGQRTGTAPQETFRGLAFDGLASYTAEQAVLQNRGAAWQDQGKVILLGATEQTWSSNAYGSGSFDSPMVQLDGSSNKSYLYTDYSASYDPATGSVTGKAAPTATGWSWSFDGTAIDVQTSFSQGYRPGAWSGSGVAVPMQSTTQAWSSDSYGGGSFGAPVTQADGSYSRSYTTTDYSGSYSDTGSLTGTAPVAQGWSWSFDGTALNAGTTNYGFTKTDITQQFNGAIWASTGLAKLQTSTSRSYSSDNAGNGSFDIPVAAVDGSWSRSYTVTDYSGSYDSNGTLVGSSPPTVSNGYSFSFDGRHTYTKSQLQQSYNVTVWANVGRMVLSQSVSYSWSSDTSGGGSYDHPMAGPDGSWSKSEITTDYSHSYDATGRPSPTAPTGQGSSVSEDGFGNITTSIIDQVYDQSFWHSYDKLLTPQANTGG